MPVIDQNRVVELTPRERFPALVSLEDGPFSALLGLKVESAETGMATVRMPFHPRLLNFGPPDVPIHGGAIATLADFAACVAIWTLPQTRQSATISLSINYTAPGIKTDLLAHAVVKRAGKRIASLTVEIRDLDHQLVADALVIYKIG